MEPDRKILWLLLLVLAGALVLALVSCGGEPGAAEETAPAATPAAEGAVKAFAINEDCCGGACKTPAGYCCTGDCCPDLPVWQP